MTAEEKQIHLDTAVMELAAFIVAEFKEMEADDLTGHTYEDNTENLHAVLYGTIEDVEDYVVKEAMKQLGINKE